MKIPPLIVLLIALCSLLLNAQPSGKEPIRTIDFSSEVLKDGRIQFTPQLPPLLAIPGAPEPFWTFFWQFGDGHYSREETPAHAYKADDQYEVVLMATPNYDRGKVPDKKSGIAGYPGTGSATEQAIYAFKDDIHSVGIKAVRDARPSEENYLILSYRNVRTATTRGRLHLFFNEEVFPNAQFEYDTAHTAYGERERAEALSLAPVPDLPAFSFLASVRPEGPAMPLPPLGIQENERQQVIDEARANYKEHKSWDFDALAPGEERNLFVAIRTTPEMLKDTSVIVHILAIVDSDNGAFATEVLEIPIVSAHDPNVQQVSERRTGFRRIRKKELTYTTRFQNTGEGPAEMVRIEIAFRPEKVLDIEKVAIKSTHLDPELPACSETITTACIDNSQDGEKLVFTFKEIYLPGMDQKGVSDKDSTKGFIKYALVPSKKMKRKSFKSRAAIYFDKEAPIYTNWARTRFKRFEPSPVVMLGYNFASDDIFNRFTAGIGVASAYKAHGFYLQPEIHLGGGGDSYMSSSNASFSSVDTVYIGPMANGAYEAIIADSTTMVTNQLSGQSRSTLELVPVHLRWNFNKFIGIGAGASLNFDFRREVSNSVTELITNRQVCIAEIPDGPLFNCGEVQTDQFTSESPSEASNSTNTNIRLFLDLNVGLAKAGPVLGVRSYVQANDWSQYAANLYLGWRF